MDSAKYVTTQENIYKYRYKINYKNKKKKIKSKKCNTVYCGLYKFIHIAAMLMMENSECFTVYSTEFEFRSLMA